MIRGLKNDSRIKKGGNKQKMVLAKNPKQLIIAVIVFILFFLNGVFAVYRFNKEQNPQISENKTTLLLNNSNQQKSTPDDLAAVGTNAENNAQNLAQEANDIYTQTIGMQKNKSASEAPITTNNQTNAIGQPKEINGDSIEIISKPTAQKGRSKMVSIVVESSGRTNPFMPGADNSSFTMLPPPPDTLPTKTDATKIITTTISGILYDQYSPSAIINIEGSDYLVKKGDTINSYKVLAIGKNQVVVRLGRNVYKAGVGELLSKADMNYNTIANLNKKFGGNEVSIKVKKKGY